MNTDMMCAVACMAMDKIYGELKTKDITASYEIPGETEMELA